MCIARSLLYGAGGLCPGGVSVQGGSLSGEGSLPGGLCRRGGSAREVSVQEDLPNRDPPVNRITDGCKNITLPQLHCGR